MKDLRKSTDNPQVWKKVHKAEEAGCVFCPWHRGENARRKQKYQKSSHRRD